MIIGVQTLALQSTGPETRSQDIEISFGRQQTIFARLISIPDPWRPHVILYHSKSQGYDYRFPFPSLSQCAQEIWGTAIPLHSDMKQGMGKYQLTQRTRNGLRSREFNGENTDPIGIFSKQNEN